MKGAAVASATVTATLDVAGGDASGTYRVTMSAAVASGRPGVTGWSMAPA